MSFLLGFEDYEFETSRHVPFGAAYVKFNSVHAREAMINASPHKFEDVQISLQKHNEDINWKGLSFNRECWLMLVGFSLDFWSMSYI